MAPPMIFRPRYARAMNSFVPQITEPTGAAKDGSPVMRLVTHYGIEQADIDRVIDAFAVALGAQPAVAGVAARA
jgi:hypothetical protein